MGGGALKKKIHLIKWEVVCFDKGKEGLGNRNLQKLNKVRLGKGFKGLLKKMMVVGKG